MCAVRVCKLKIFYDLIWCAIILQAVDRIGQFEQKTEDANLFQPSNSKKVTIKEPLRWDEYQLKVKRYYCFALPYRSTYSVKC